MRPKYWRMPCWACVWSVVGWPDRRRRVGAVVIGLGVLCLFTAVGAFAGASAVARVRSNVGAGHEASIPWQARGGGLVSDFGEHGVRIAGAGHAELLLGLAAIGRGSRLESLPAVAPQRHLGRVSYTRSRNGVIEWYANGPFGLEQGFTLAHRPAGAGRLTLAVGSVPGGERARIAPDGSSLVILGSGHRALLRYGSLTVTDAAGRRLPARIGQAGAKAQIGQAGATARIGQAGATVLLSVDDAGARYPITIDPLAGNVESTSGDGKAGDAFGSSVAVSGDTMVVGAPNRTVGLNTQQGAVYVFSDSSGTWQQTAELTADNELNTTSSATRWRSRGARSSSARRSRSSTICSARPRRRERCTCSRTRQDAGSRPPS